MDPIVAITGGAGALGSTLARVLAAQGYKVALFDVERSKERAAALAKEIGAFSFTSEFARSEDWEKGLAATKEALGGMPTHAALIAGGWDGGAPLHAAKEETYDKMMRSNVESTFRALRALLPSMVESKRGSIVAVGSRVALRPWTSTGAALYAASKSAVVAMIEASAQECLEHGVRLNSILPSAMDTPANRASMPNVDPKTWVSLDSAAGVIAFLLSDAARDISGAAIPVYGRA